MESRLISENRQLRHELQVCEVSASGDANKMESTATLREVLKQAQVAWSTADAESRFLKLQQKELETKVILLKSEIDAAATRREADTQREVTSASHVQAQLLSVQTEFVTERAKVSELNCELRAARSELHDWNEQYEFQIQTGDGYQDHPPEAKDPTARRLLPEEEDDERYQSPPPRQRPGEPGSAGTDLRNPLSPSQAGGEATSPSAAKFKEAERIRVTAWPKPAN